MCVSGICGLIGRTARLVLGVLLMIGAHGTASAKDAPDACPGSARTVTGAAACACSPESIRASLPVWGTDIYSDDSSICRAAAHAGAIEAAGGNVIVVPLPGRAAYAGSARNGVTTADWTSHPRSFVVLPLDPQAAMSEQVANATAIATAMADHVPGATGIPAGVPRCPRNFQDQAQALTCACPAGSFDGEAWGTDSYTADSAVCRSALHAGAVTTAGGVVRVTPAVGLPAYAGTIRNGVTTQPWQSFERGFIVAPAAPGEPAGACPASFPEGSAAFTCSCSAEQLADPADVWGTDIYTTDSSICRAALHAGAVPAAGGVVRVLPEGGRASYAPSLRNGVRSQSWGEWRTSFRIEGGK